MFVLVFVPGFLFDWIQVVVRLWDANYETGLPSTLSLVWTFGFLFLACVLILANTERKQ